MLLLRRLHGARAALRPPATRALSSARDERETQTLAHRRSLEQPERFWAEAAAAIPWFTEPTRILDYEGPAHTTWFPDGELNTCFVALDQHVLAGRGEQTAIIYDSPATGGRQEHVSYADLLARVSHFAGQLRDLGVEKGDRVVIYMPMTVDVVVAMLGCARLGAIHSVVFGGFAPAELAARIDDARPKVLVTGSCGFEPGRVVEYKPLVDAAVELTAPEHRPERVLVVQRPDGPEAAVDAARGDVLYDPADASVAPEAVCTPVAADDPLYILYTSGTTGSPKGVVRDNGGHAVALTFAMKHVYGIEQGDVWWAASDVGWVVGHSWICYGPLMSGATTVLFEGKPILPDAGVFWRVASEHKVKSMFTAPTALRAIRQADPEGALIHDYDMSGFDALFLAGERADPDTLQWTEGQLGLRAYDQWWQTESGWPKSGNCLGLGDAREVVHGAAGRPVPGYDVRVLKADSAEEAAPGELGRITVRAPLPPGTLRTLWRDHQRFQDAYFEGDSYITGDSGMLDEAGFLHVLTRLDDVINVAGHRLSTGRLEEVLYQHPAVVDAAVVGVQDELKGQVPVGFVVVAGDTPFAEADVVDMVREQVGAVAAFRRCVVVPRLPKTRSGKIVRGTMQAIADGRPYKPPATIEDASVLEWFEDFLSSSDSDD